MTGYSRLRFVPILGLAGSGKSEAIAKFKENGEPVLSIEDIAGVEGVCLAGLFGENIIGQEELEKRLFDLFEQLDIRKSIYVEWKKVEITGYFLPDSLVAAIRNSPAIYIEEAFKDRVENLLSKYSEWNDHLDVLFRKLTDSGFDRDLLAKLMNAASVSTRKFVEVLLSEYLDPLYLQEIGLFKIHWRGDFEAFVRRSHFFKTFSPHPSVPNLAKVDGSFDRTLL